MARDGYNESDYNAGRGSPTEESQSPQAHRGTAQDFEQFTKDDVQVSHESPDPNVERSFDEFPGKGNDGSF
jgi:hypothetical protein